jgi:micrococcal nuclease
LCHEKSAELRPQTRDRYGRTVARVSCGGRDASVAQLQAGMAWAFTKYLTDKSLPVVEASARAERRGLWADPAPVAPWEWRKARPAA